MKSLAAHWREEAATLRAWGCGQPADVLERCASELEARQQEYELEALSLEEAVEESGYSYSAIQKKLATGELENVGEKGSPRVRRGHLPKKGGTPASGLADTVLLRRLK